MNEAIAARHSVRQYNDKAIEPEKLALLRQAIDEANRTAGLHLQLVSDEPEAFAHGLAKYGKFSGVRNYVALVCRRGDDELVGYHGEHLVLLAQTLGLNSCWVGLTFSKQPSRYEVEEGEKLLGVIALGYGVTQGSPHPMKPLSTFYKAADAVPECFLRGVESAALAPTAMNMQKFLFELLPDGRVAARTRFALMGNYLKLDLGIVKCHFELGAGSGSFEWA